MAVMRQEIEKELNSSPLVNTIYTAYPGVVVVFKVVFSSFS